MKEFEVWGEFITLGQLLKAAGVVDSGGEVRYFLESQPVQVNGKPESRRGRKLVPGDRVTSRGLDLTLVIPGAGSDDTEAAAPLYEKPETPPETAPPLKRGKRRVMRRGSRRLLRK